MRDELTVKSCYDDDLITATKPTNDRLATVAIRSGDGTVAYVVYLTADDALQLAYTLLPDGYAINDPDA
jgi:hypothetical protein